jgi:uncharacterized membrane protein (DUF4010 family)
VWGSLAIMALATGLLAAYHYRLGADGVVPSDGARLPIRNPFSLGEAVRFGLLFAVILLAVKIAQQELPSVGLYVVSALAGTADVDAITLSLAGHGPSPQHIEEASVALLIALLSNTVVKCLTVQIFGAGPMRLHIAVATASIAVAGTVAGSLLLQR